MTNPKIIITSTPKGSNHFYDTYMNEHLPKCDHNWCHGCGHNYFSGGFGNCKWCLDENIEEICNNLNDLCLYKWSNYKLFKINEFKNPNIGLNKFQKLICFDAEKCNKFNFYYETTNLDIDKIINFMFEVILNKYKQYYNLIIVFQYKNNYFRVASQINGEPIEVNKNCILNY